MLFYTQLKADKSEMTAEMEAFGEILGRNMDSDDETQDDADEAEEPQVSPATVFRSQ